MTQLTDAHVLITGGSRGIGLATARRALQRGARVSLVARAGLELVLGPGELLDVARYQRDAGSPLERPASGRQADAA